MIVQHYTAVKVAHGMKPINGKSGTLMSGWLLIIFGGLPALSAEIGSPGNIAPRDVVWVQNVMQISRVCQITVPLNSYILGVLLD